MHRFVSMMVNGILRLSLLQLLVWLPMSAFAQKVEADILPAEIVIGQQAMLSLQVELSESGVLIWPNLADTLTADIEVIRSIASDSIKKDNNLVYHQKKWVVTAWKDGFFPIPPIKIIHITNNDTIFLETKAMLLQVGGVEVNLEEGYKDIKPIWYIPRGVRQFLPHLIALLILAMVVYWYLKRRKTRLQDKPADNSIFTPGVPLHIAAISSLETLRRKQLWLNNKEKQHHSELTNILRTYISRRHGFHALEMTTSEIMHAFRQHASDAEAGQLLQDILQVADLVKFAKYSPAPASHEESIEKALSFIQRTTPDRGEQSEQDD